MTLIAKAFALWVIADAILLLIWIGLLYLGRRREQRRISRRRQARRGYVQFGGSR